MPTETLLIFLVSYILLHIKPGPGQAFRIGCALDKGFACAMSVTVGVSVICTIYFLIVALSYNGLINYFESLAPVFKVLGGLYLIYLGGNSFLKRKNEKTASPPSSQRAASLFKFFTIGVLLSLSNPMDIVYFLSVLPNLVPLGELTTTGLIQGASIVFFTGIIIDTLILSLVVLTKDSLINNKFANYINIIASVAFILIGIFFIYSVFFMESYTLDLV